MNHWNQVGRMGPKAMRDAACARSAWQRRPSGLCENDLKSVTDLPVKFALALRKQPARRAHSAHCHSQLSFRLTPLVFGALPPSSLVTSRSDAGRTPRTPEPPGSLSRLAALDSPISWRSWRPGGFARQVPVDPLRPTKGPGWRGRRRRSRLSDRRGGARRGRRGFVRGGRYRFRLRGWCWRHRGGVDGR